MTASAADQGDKLGGENQNPTPSRNYQNTDIPEVAIRDAKLGDVEKLSDLYMNLSEPSRRFFHPFPFEKNRLKIIFLIMIFSQRSLNLLTKILPNFGFHVLVAHNTDKDKLVGFTYFSITRKDKGRLIANRGIVTTEGARAAGLGTLMDLKLIEIARRSGISRFEVSALKDNSASIALHRKVGYVITGSTKDSWNDKIEESFTLSLDLKDKGNDNSK